MNETERILCEHFLRYPEMEVGDAVKLLYQNEFGCGHLISDEGMALNYLCKEYASLEKKEDSLYVEEIGNGLCRIYLAGLTEEGLMHLGKAFLRSAKPMGNLESFKEKLAMLFSRETPFLQKETESFLKEYAEAGYPMLSHSAHYRETYHPAYRVCLKEEAKKEGLL